MCIVINYKNMYILFAVRTEKMLPQTTHQNKSSSGTHVDSYIFNCSGVYLGKQEQEVSLPCGLHTKPFPNPHTNIHTQLKSFSLFPVSFKHPWKLSMCLSSQCWELKSVMKAGNFSSQMLYPFILSLSLPHLLSLPF